ncbi:MAG: ABC transporter ATP-binding protein [Gemmatimonadaceae bacterium]|jgi:ABC-2 type transport system ATP-binding protein|nr:ABC transporter ATP-binding protein [Gemmatimonadaceae bacterium]
MNTAIEFRDVSYRYRRTRPVLDGVDLAVPASSVYGFLGPNGAGKTTTIRLMLGLLRPQSGRIQVLGHDLRRSARPVLGRIGSLVEGPSLYGQLSARENLECWRLVHGVSRARIDAVLELVDLAHTGRQPARDFSLGMRQRLGVAVALLHAPRLLVLDEPTNGLDPHGIVAMRQLLRRLADNEGVTVFVSSHLLGEVERLVTHLCVLHGGRVVEAGTMATVARAAGARTRFTCDLPERALAVLAGLALPATREATAVCTALLTPDQVADVVRALVKADVGVHAIEAGHADLEAHFHRLTTPTST